MTVCFWLAGYAFCSISVKGLGLGLSLSPYLPLQKSLEKE